MPTPEPYEFRLVLAMQTVLAAISTGTLASDGLPYWFDVAGAAVKLNPDSDVEALAAPEGLRPFIVIEAQPDNWALSPARVVAITLPLRLHWFCDTDATNDASKLQTYFRGAADLERAVEGAARVGTLPSATHITGRGISRTQLTSSRLWTYMDLNIVVNRRYGAPMGN